MVKHRQVPIVGKGHVLHINLPPHLPKLPGVCSVLLAGFRGHDVPEPGQASKAAGEHLREIGQLPHGTHKGADVQGEG